MSIGNDKFGHAIVGAVIAIVFAAFCMQFGFNPWFAMIPVVLIGAFKEWYWDKRHGGAVEFLDFLFTVLGGLVVEGIIYLLV